MSGFQIPSEIEGALDAEERVVWMSKPTDRLFVFGGFDFLLLPFGLFFVGIALVSQVDAIRQGQLFGFFFVMPHLLMGLWLAFGRLFVGRHYRQMMTYAVTDRKAYILSKAFGGRLIQKPITAGTSIDFQPGKDATIRIDPTESTPIARQWAYIWPSHASGFEFFRIPDGQQAINTLREVQRGRS